MKRHIISLIFIFYVLTGSVASAERMRIAILDLKAEGVANKIAKNVTNMIRTDLINLDKFIVIERTQMDKIMEEQGFQQTGCTDQECAVQIGKVMAARKILIGEVSSMGEAILITVRIVDVEKAISEHAARSKAKSIDDLDTAITSLTKELSGRIEGEKKGFFASLFGKSEEDVEAKKPEKKKEPEKKEAKKEVKTAPRVITPVRYYVSGIFPGIGQIYAGEKKKGPVFLFGFVASGIMSFYFHNNFKSKKGEYMSLDYDASQKEFDKKNSEMKKAGKYAIAAISITGLIYIANWADIIFFTKPVFGKSISKDFSGREFFSFNFNDDKGLPAAGQRLDISAGIRF